MESVVNKRILLSKEFYLNGVELARKSDPLSKMMSVHNFHIGIEIAIKSILLKYEIRNEKTLNIDFESMLNEIDKHKDFQDKGLRLPYRQEIRNLNQMRNLVQHHAMEPDQSSMDDWRLFSSRFLRRVFNDYFDVDFDKVNRITFISDKCLAKYLSKALEYISANDYSSASCFAAAAFEYATMSISSFIPNSSGSFFAEASLRQSGFDSGGLQRAFKITHERINQSEHFAGLLSSGLSLSDYRKYKDNSPIVHILFGGKPVFEFMGGEASSIDSSTWLIQFVIATVVKWQQVGLEPKVPVQMLAEATRFVEDSCSEGSSVM